MSFASGTDWTGVTITSNSLRGKTAVVTGASSGIGAEIARELNRAGANVLLVGRNRQRLESVLAELDTVDAAADVLSIDITALDCPDEVIARSRSRFGAIDIMVHAYAYD